MLITSIMISLLFFLGIHLIFQEKNFLFFVNITILNFLFSLKFYSMFIGDLSLDSLNSVFFLPTLDMVVISFLMGLQLFFLTCLYHYLVERKTLTLRYNFQGSLTRIVFFRQKFISISSLFFILVGFLFLFSCYWAISYFGEIDINQIIYTLKEPLSGTGNEQIENFLFYPLLNSLLSGLITWNLVNFFIKYKLILKADVKKESLGFWKYLLLPVSFIILFANLYFGLSVFGFQELKTALFDKTEFYDSYYVKPKNIDISFPEEKRNLIYIYVESLEATYLSTELGGTQLQNLMPNLSDLATQNINFSNTTNLGGALSLPGTNFTAAGMVAQTSGTPLRTNVTTGDNPNVDGNVGNAYGQNTKSFLPGVCSLGEILEKEGYHQQLMIGSNAAFGGREKYFTEHGNYEIIDYDHAKKEGWIPEDYYAWWGYEDEKLFEFAKGQLLDLASSDRPFNFTLLTADTHFPEGYMSENTPTLFEDQYSNVIYWSDQMIADFIRFIQEQPFYDKTTIVLSGDHLTMDQNFIESVPEGYDRTVFDLIINSAVNPSETKKREFSTLDLFPTTLSALGVKIPGDRLGLGTDLFSSTPTIIEELGYETVNQELQKKTLYYDFYLMQNTDEEINPTSTSSSSN